MQDSASDSGIVWRQVWGLSVLLAAIIFSWTIYGIYQPQILQTLGFVKLAAWLGVFQGVLGVVIEPIVGGISDRVIQRRGSRLPMITTGVTLAGLIFVSVALLIQVNLPVEARWLVPVLMTLWVISMIIFRGPVVALLQQSAPLAAIPQANVVLTVVFGLVSALEPLLSHLFRQVGGAITLMLGAIALVVGASVLYALAPPRRLFAGKVGQSGQNLSPLSPADKLRLTMIFAVGVGTGLCQNLLLRTFPNALATGNLSVPLITSGVLLISAISAVPLQAAINGLGLSQSMLWGTAGVTLCTGLALLQPNQLVTVGLILLAGAAFGIIFISQIPFALTTGPNDRAGLSTGLLFGGIGAATALVSALLQVGMAASATLVWAAVGLTITGLAIAVSRNLQPSH
jgi:MFS family permease